jgi:hypothetical protein
LALLLFSSPGALLAGCSNNSGRPVRASLAELVADQDDYDGRRVETAGVVRRFGEADGATRLHYVVEDQRANRVAIVPNEVAEPHTGRQVVVVGLFRFSEAQGRSIEIERIEPR